MPVYCFGYLGFSTPQATVYNQLKAEFLLGNVVRNVMEGVAACFCDAYGTLYKDSTTVRVVNNGGIFAGTTVNGHATSGNDFLMPVNPMDFMVPNRGHLKDDKRIQQFVRYILDGFQYSNSLDTNTGYNSLLTFLDETYGPRETLLIDGKPTHVPSNVNTSAFGRIFMNAAVEYITSPASDPGLHLRKVYDKTFSYDTPSRTLKITSNYNLILNQALDVVGGVDIYAQNLILAFVNSEEVYKFEPNVYKYIQAYIKYLPPLKKSFFPT